MNDALRARGMSQAELSEQLGATQSMISVWRNGVYEAPHDTVFAIERVLNLAPGHLSRRVGYLPLEAVERPEVTVEEAVLNDALLNEADKQTMIALYEHLVTAEPPAPQSTERATKPRPTRPRPTKKPAKATQPKARV